MEYGYIIEISTNSKFTMQKICLVGIPLRIEQINKSAANISKDSTRHSKVYPSALKTNHSSTPTRKIKFTICIHFIVMFRSRLDTLKKPFQSRKLCS